MDAERLRALIAAHPLDPSAVYAIDRDQAEARKAFAIEKQVVADARGVPLVKAIAVGEDVPVGFNVTDATLDEHENGVDGAAWYTFNSIRGVDDVIYDPIDLANRFGKNGVQVPEFPTLPVATFAHVRAIMAERLA